MNIWLRVNRVRRDTNRYPRLAAGWTLLLDGKRFHEKEFDEIPTTLQQVIDAIGKFYDVPIYEAWLEIKDGETLEEIELP